MNPKYGYLGMIAALGALSVIGPVALPQERIDLSHPQGRPEARAPKPYRDRIRYRKRREWDGRRNDLSLLDRARGAVAR